MLTENHMFSSDLCLCIGIIYFSKFSIIQSEVKSINKSVWLNNCRCQLVFRNHLMNNMLLEIDQHTTVRILILLFL